MRAAIPSRLRKPPAAEKAPAAGKPPPAAWRVFYKRSEKPLLVAAGVLLAALLVGLHAALTPSPSPLVPQQQIEAAVQRTLESKVLPSKAAKAYEGIHRSIVRVRAIGDGLDHDEYVQKAIGSGVVIVDSGIILTSLHVVAGASKVRVLFIDGTESDAKVISMQPENDLAVVQAESLPDDLFAATMGSVADLAPGDDVAAVGFPFGIGPSVTAGVVSGLKRQFRSPGGSQLNNLIQFDAAVNPGSSGGPLVNAAGEVVGIVTAILDPTERGAFSGIGFAVPIETAAAAAGQVPF